jgi:hypothetical protein
LNIVTREYLAYLRRSESVQNIVFHETVRFITIYSALYIERGFLQIFAMFISLTSMLQLQQLGLHFSRR